MLSRPLPPSAVASSTSSSRRANTASLRHHSATRGASARRGATIRIPFADWTIGVSHGGSPPKPPEQAKGAAEGDGDEQNAQGLGHAVLRWASSLDGGSLARLALVLAMLIWRKGLATTADVEKIVTDVEKIVTDSEGRTKERLDSPRTEMKGSVKWVATWPNVVVAVVAVVLTKLSEYAE